MIRYSLKCADGHAFDAWFPNSAAFEEQRAGGHLSCAVCGQTSVEKALMAPAVPAKAPLEPSKAAPAKRSPDAPGPLAAPASPAEAAVRAMREAVIEKSDYVGPRFAAEARAIHEGASEKRAVWGEATSAEVKALHEDGVPAFPMPGTGGPKAN